jgi:hypothetical protein
MSGEPGAGARVVTARSADLLAIEAAVRAAHDGLLEQARGALSDVRIALAQWSDATDSRQAQLQFERELGHRVEELAAALDRIAEQLVLTQERAAEAQARALAALD